MLFDKRVLQPDSLAKYAAAFFKMSRSSVSRLTSVRKRLSSAASALSCLRCSVGLLYRFNHPYMLCVDTPRRAATSATGRPCSATCLTAATLNSSVNRALLINVSLRRYYEAKMCLVNLGRFRLSVFLLLIAELLERKHKGNSTFRLYYFRG